MLWSRIVGTVVDEVDVEVNVSVPREAGGGSCEAVVGGGIGEYANAGSLSREIGSKVDQVLGNSGIALEGSGSFHRG